MFIVFLGGKTSKEVIDMLQDSYVECGGKNATPEKMLKFIEKKYNYNGMAYYEIPEDVEKYPVVSKEELKGVITGYLTLLSGSLDRFCDDDLNPSVMRIQCQLKTRSTEKTKEIIDFCNDYAEKNFPKGYQLKFTGAAEMEYTMTKLIVKSQITSLLISIISAIASQMGKEWREANPDEEAQGIDGFIGDKPLQIKSSTYKLEAHLLESIEVPIVYYDKKKDGINIEYNPADF